MSAPSTPHSTSGFSLVELAVLLTIYGGIAAMAVVVGKEWIEKERFDVTRQNLETIQLALENYAKLNGRLPCPGQLSLTPSDANYGLEAWEKGTETLADNICYGTAGSIAAGNATNDVVFGSVPAKTLGIGENLMRDQWGGLIVYYVTERTVLEGSFWLTPKHSNYLEMDDATAGTIVINDMDGTARTSSAMFALVSHGEDQHGAYNVKGTRVTETLTLVDNERENCDCDDTPTTVWGSVDHRLVQQMLDNNFDDLVLFGLRRNFLVDQNIPY